MKNTRRENQLENIEREIEQVIELLGTESPDSKEYKDLLERLGTLYSYKDKYKKFKVDQNTIATIAGSIIGIVLITAYEKTNVLTSKALSFVLRKRA